MTTKNLSPLFEGLSLEEPSILSISFESDPSASLGVKLCNHDNGMFSLFSVYIFFVFHDFTLIPSHIPYHFSRIDK